MVHRSATRLYKLVNTLLEITRIEAGRLQPVYEAVDLATLTSELAIVPARLRAGAAGPARECTAGSDPVFVDRAMWEQIVLNLLSNALKFTFDGGVDVSLARADGDVVLRISDTGVGIPGDALPRLFDRFYRAEGTRARTQRARDRAGPRSGSGEAAWRQRSPSTAHPAAGPPSR